jgi:hypothetical protein
MNNKFQHPNKRKFVLIEEYIYSEYMKLDSTISEELFEQYELDESELDIHEIVARYGYLLSV